VNGVLRDFYEVVIPQSFDSIIFDIKMRYFEDTRDIGAEGGEIQSTLESGVKVIIHKRTFDDDAKVKVRVS